MEYYDVIIIGAGIAGCGLAYNLKRIDYKGSVLVIDKNEVGSNIGYGYRNTFKEIIEDYDLPYAYRYKGVHLGTFDKICITLNVDFYLVDYNKICNYLLNKSDFYFKREIGVDLQNNILTTDKSQYKFRYLIDCAGHKSFLRKLFKKREPILYYLGDVGIFENKSRKTSKFFTFLSDDKGFIEDFYLLKDKVISGYWQISKKIDFSLIKPPDNTLRLKHSKNNSRISQAKIILPSSPILPLSYRNYAFLGDSFGNATPIAAEGVRPILRASEILAESIKKNNLIMYDKTWRKKYLNQYIKYISMRFDPILRDKLVRAINPKIHHDVCVSILRGDEVRIPKEMMKNIPMKMMAKQLFFNSSLKLKYLLTSNMSN